MQQDNYIINHKERIQGNFLFLDIPLVLIALCSIALGLFLYLYNPFRVSPLRNLEIIGEVKSQNLEPKRKIIGSLSWIEVNKGDALYNGDEILTTQKSSTTILLKGGSELYVAPESLIRLEFTKNDFKIELIKGKVECKKDVEPKIKVIQKDTGRATYLSAGRSIKSRLFGRVTKPLIASGISQRKILSGRNAKPGNAAPPLTSPKIDTPEPEQLPKDATPLAAQKIDPVIESLPIPENASSEKPITQDLSSKKMSDAPKANPKIKKKEIVTKPKPLEAPSVIPSQILTYIENEKDEYYKLKFIPVPNAKKYMIEVYSDSDLSKVVLKTTNSAPDYIFKSNRSGRFFYRIRIEDSFGRLSPWSEKGTFMFPISPLEEL